MTVHLLDVNVLLALADARHVHHEAAHRWFASRGSDGWATCPITENAFVRIASHPSYPDRPGEATVVLGLLRRICQHAQHRFWPDVISLQDALGDLDAMTHSQVTDLYLLALAVSNGGRLATFDRRIPATVVPGGPDAFELIRS